MCQETLHLWSEDEQWVTMPAKVIDHFRNYRFLKFLVMSVPDSFLFRRQGDEITYIPYPNVQDTPWRDDVAQVILAHFGDDLRAIMPQGEWGLGLRSITDEESSL